MAGLGPLRRLRGDQLVDPAAEMAQHEIVADRGPAFVDLLHPLLDRHLDAESLVDGKGNIEKIQAVDAEIVDRMRFRANFCPIYIADLGDDACHRVEGRTHYLPAFAPHPARAESKQILSKSQSTREAPTGRALTASR